MFRTLALSVLVCAIAGCATLDAWQRAKEFEVIKTPSSTDASSMPSFDQKRFRIEQRIDPRQSFRIENHCGNVQIRDSNKAHWLGIAVIAQQAPNTSMPFAELKQTGSVFSLRLRCPGRSSRARSRADIAAYLPNLAQLEIATHDGEIRALTLTVPSSVKTDSGRVLINTQAALNARSNTGPLHLNLQNSNVALYAHSQRADIELSLPDQATRIQASATGIDNQTRRISVTQKPANVRLHAPHGRITLIGGFVD